MRKPSVFVSSTCFDLKQLRADIRDSLETLGLEPVLSEFNMFPVDPSAGTIENCLKAVEARANIFVLIVGARYGSVTEQGKSITNLEYLTAKAKGIPTYVFVVRSVLDILPVWKMNPSADFSGVTDSPRLFEFVASLRETGDTWVFPFETAQEIFQTLRTQLAYLFMDALELRLRANNAGGLSATFQQLRGPALRLILERPVGWEYLLFFETLEDEFSRLYDLRRDWEYGVAMGPGSRQTLSELYNWFLSKFPEASRIALNLDSLFQQALPVAFGPSGVSGDPEAILYAAKRIAAAYRNVLEWKLDFLRLSIPREMATLRSLAASFCDNVVTEIEEYLRSSKISVTNAVAAIGSGQKVGPVELILRLTAPDSTAFTKEMERVNRLIKSGALDWD